MELGAAGPVGRSGGQPSQRTVYVEEMDEDEDEEEERLPWEEEERPLSAELKVCLERVAGGYRFPIKGELQELPVYAGLKRIAEANNHQRDGQGQVDRWLRGVQQRVLHLLRFSADEQELRATDAPAEEQLILGLKAFTFLA